MNKRLFKALALDDEYNPHLDKVYPAGYSVVDVRNPEDSHVRQMD